MVNERRQSIGHLTDEICRVLRVRAKTRRGPGPYWVQLQSIEHCLDACADDVHWAVLRGVEQGRLRFTGVPAYSICLTAPRAH
jgi:hypothetical protein